MTWKPMLASRARVAAALIAALVAASLAPVSSAAADCTSAPANAFFVGVIYDYEAEDGRPPRQDFQQDVDNFEFFLSKLRANYCIPDANAKILAFFNNYTRNGKTYPAATERAVVDTLKQFGAAASTVENPILFFMLSSHGLVKQSFCNGVRRVTSSFSGLRAGGGHDGDLRDCELGVALNTNFPTDTKMLVMVDCSVCGGFSDSTTAVSGTVPDGSVPPSGIVGPNRVVITGCAISTECFGSSNGSGAVTYGHMRRVLEQGTDACDGYTAPGFPQVQGINVPVKDQGYNTPDGRCTASELLFAAVWRTYIQRDVIGIQQQYRIKYGFPTLAEDLLIS